MREQNEQADRIAQMKQAESKLQRRMIEKIQQDRQRELNIQAMLKESVGLDQFLMRSTRPPDTFKKEPVQSIYHYDQEEPTV